MEDLATVIAIVSLAISSAVFGWTVYRDMSNRGMLRVECFIGKLVTTVDGGDNVVSGPKLVYIVTNIGRQPIVLKEIGGKEKRDKEHSFMITSNSLPKMLKPGEYIMEYTDSKLLEKEINYLHAEDSLKRIYKLKKRDFKRLLKSFQSKEYETGSQRATY